LSDIPPKPKSRLTVLEALVVLIDEHHKLLPRTQEVLAGDHLQAMAFHPPLVNQNSSRIFFFSSWILQVT
jgi:hypothetical protein